MKRILGACLGIVCLFSLTGCGMGIPQMGKSIALTIAETMPSCVAFEYKDEKAYCFYAYDADGKSYRVFWTSFTGLSEKDQIIVEYDAAIKTLSYNEPLSGWTPQYEIVATNVKKEEIDEENPSLHIQIQSGANTIYPYSCLMWSKTDNGNGTFTEATVDKYHVVDLVSGKTHIPVTDIPTIVLEESIEYLLSANGSIEKLYLLVSEGSEYKETETTFEDLSNLADGTYYVVLEVLVRGNSDWGASQNAYRYEDVFCLVIKKLSQS